MLYCVVSNFNREIRGNVSKYFEKIIIRFDWIVYKNKITPINPFYNSYFQGYTVTFIV